MCNQPAVFNYANWALMWPQLAASVSAPQAQMYWNEAQLFCDNSSTSIISNVAPAYVRTSLLNYATAHIATLRAVITNPANGQPQQPSPLVGRIHEATEGSVTVTTQNDYPPGSAQWWQQTQPGAFFWAASSKYRMAMYVPGPCNAVNPYNLNTILAGRPNG
jgi:hypothetical protein